MHNKIMLKERVIEYDRRERERIEKSDLVQVKMLARTLM